MCQFEIWTRSSGEGVGERRRESVTSALFQAEISYSLSRYYSFPRPMIVSASRDRSFSARLSEIHKTKAAPLSTPATRLEKIQPAGATHTSLACVYVRGFPFQPSHPITLICTVLKNQTKGTKEREKEKSRRAREDGSLRRFDGCAGAGSSGAD